MKKPKDDRIVLREKETSLATKENFTDRVPPTGTSEPMPNTPGSLLQSDDLGQDNMLAVFWGYELYHVGEYHSTPAMWPRG